jgi:S-methyl-5-thioribose-1-phosphate isomerase
MRINGKDYQSIWLLDTQVLMIDQNKLPFDFEIHTCNTCAEVALAIQNMTVRGAPAIGAAGAFGLALSALSASEENFSSQLQLDRELLLTARPTAIDLKKGVRHVYEQALQLMPDLPKARIRALQSANEFAFNSAEECRMIGEVGQSLITAGMNILTHCNAGALATVDWGTALSVLRQAHSSGRKFFVYVDETRPRLQGSRLTAFELSQEGIPHAVIVDCAAGWLMQQGKIDLIITGADRICLNGDFTNKIGTYSLAVLAKEHHIPFYVAAPQSTFDPDCPEGSAIPIEQRSASEIKLLNDQPLANPDSDAYNPAFDVTPARLVTAYITSKGIFKPDEVTRKICSRISMS